MTPVGLKKNEATCLGEMPNDYDPTVEVVQEGVSYPQANEKETQEAVQELTNQLNGMVDQATQTPPQATLEETFNSKVKLVGVYDSPEAFSQAMNGERKVNTPKYQTPPPPPPKDDIKPFTRMVNFANIFRTPVEEYMICPYHRVRLEERKSKNGWEYLKCPMVPCLLFCPKEKAIDYMTEAHYRPHPDVRNVWSCLSCFCREPATLQQSHSSDNPRRMFLTCSKKKCNFFRSADKPLGQKYRDWLFKKEEKPEHPLPTRDANGYPLRGYDIPDSLPPPSP